MSFSGSKVVADINLDEFERRLRAAGALPTDADDPLLELARLVESAARSASSTGAVAIPTEGDERGALERGALHPASEEAVDFHEAPAVDHAPAEDHARAGNEESHAPPVEDFHVQGTARAQPARRRDLGWTVKVSALAIAGVGMIGAVFVIKGGVPGLPKQVPFIAAAQGPTKVLPPSDDTVSTSNDAGASLLKDNTKSTKVKVVGSEEQPVDLNALAPSSVANAPAQAAAVAPNGDPAGTAVKPTADAPVVVATAAPSPPAPSAFPDPKPVRTVSLRPDGTPIPTPVVASADAGAAAPVVAASEPPVKPAAKPTTSAASNAQASSPRLQLPAKLSGKSPARVTVAKADAAAPNSIAEAANEPLPPAAKPAKGAKAQQVAAPVAAPEPQVGAAAPAAPATPSDSAPQSDNPVLHALSALVGSNAAPAAPAAPPEQVDSVAATKSSGWAVQLEAPRSEAEANSEMAKLSAKYSTALNGSTIGVHKAVVNGNTIYRLRVVGLSKADAAALCARLKGEGRGCFIAK
jgi:hypothetical protein